MNIVRLAGILGFAGVALGAFGAHALRTRVEPRFIEIWQTGVQYHLLHVLALLALAALGQRVARPTAVAALFTAGIVIFSGSLYALVLTGQRWLGAITPMGGVAFLIGWALLAIFARRAA